MSQSGYYSQNSEDLKDQVSNAADAVQQASVDAYESVRDTAQEQPFISGMLVGALVGFALGALWKLESRRSLPAHRSIASITTLTPRCDI